MAPRGRGTDVPDQAPGWYTDPEHGGRLSYWDGERWTGEHRPRPAWQAPDPAAEAAREREARRKLAHGPRSWVVVGGVVAFIVFMAWVTLPKSDNPGPKVLTDQSYIDQANARCKEKIIGLRPKIFTDPKDAPSTEVVAADIDRVADGLAKLAAELRTIPAATADQPHITGWLSGWDRYASIGHDYAQALRSNDPKAQLRNSKAGDQAQKTADRFARANDIDRCQFFIEPRGTGSDPFSGNQ